jgi:hypothetical protein
MGRRRNRSGNLTRVQHHRRADGRDGRSRLFAGADLPGLTTYTYNLGRIRHKAEFFVWVEPAPRTNRGRMKK